MCSPLKGFLLIVSLKATRDSQRFWFWLNGVQFDSAVCITPHSFTLCWVAHREAWHLGMMHNAESDSGGMMHTMELDSGVWCTLWSFLKIWISQRNRNRIQKYFTLYFRGPVGFESLKSRKSCDTPPLTFPDFGEAALLHKISLITCSEFNAMFCCLFGNK